jgi:acetyl-CoA/propionyl-CoA carboxylase biotin carboxyl carrier protein
MTAAVGYRPFARVLVANRGEIALRVGRACVDAGLDWVAVFADQDADAPHVEAAPFAVALKGRSATDTYLSIDKLIAAAAESGADAVHPGYGFLSESAPFAQAVLDAGMVWIGPPPRVIRDLGDKTEARRLAAELGVPMAPASEGAISDAAAVRSFATQHGLPIIIKAAHGGGGRGMRIVVSEDEIDSAFTAATIESTSAFGRPEVFVERFLAGGRHIEVQIVADAHGSVVVAGDRDCSLQRRHQKVVEEAPAPNLSAEQRVVLHSAAIRLCERVGYVGAGTVEFLVAPDGTISFLEVNTRLQVEHPVSEESAGVDLVRQQLHVCAGDPLTLPAWSPPARHSFEFRINAEDPVRGFLPSTGAITAFRMPDGPGVRVDAGVRVGSVVDSAFDSMLAKLIITGSTRREALERSRRALDEMAVMGPATLLPFLRMVVRHADFTGDEPAVHTRWIDENFVGGQVDWRVDSEAVHMVTVTVGGREMQVSMPGLPADAFAQYTSRGRTAGVADGVIRAPMQGTVVEVRVDEGQAVEVGDTLLVVEAMKMASPLVAPVSGTLTDLRAFLGQNVSSGTVLCRIVAA